MSIKRELFADNVAAGMGLSDAYRQAGYSARMSPGSIASTAFTLRQRPDICLMVETRLAVVAESAAVSREQIASELAKVGFANLSEGIEDTAPVAGLRPGPRADPDKPL